MLNMVKQEIIYTSPYLALTIGSVIVLFIEENMVTAFHYMNQILMLLLFAN